MTNAKSPSKRRPRGTKATVVRIWSDGIHHVARVREPDKFIYYEIKGHPAAGSPYFQRVSAASDHRTDITAAMDKALRRAQVATWRWIKQNPDHASKRRQTPLPAASSLPGKKLAKGRPTKDGQPKALAPYSLAHFQCVSANPEAQVYQRMITAYDRGVQPRGRPRKDGQAPRQADMLHGEMQCVVMRTFEGPVRETDGTVKVFTYGQALDEIANIYAAADPDERLFWLDEPDAREQNWSGSFRVVYESLDYQVIFHPEEASKEEPFYLWNTRWRRKRSIAITRPLLDPAAVARLTSLTDSRINGKASLEQAKSRRKEMEYLVANSERYHPAGETRYEQFKLLSAAISRIDEIESAEPPEILRRTGQVSHATDPALDRRKRVRENIAKRKTSA